MVITPLLLLLVVVAVATPLVGGAAAAHVRDALWKGLMGLWQQLLLGIWLISCYSPSRAALPSGCLGLVPILPPSPGRRVWAKHMRVHMANHRCTCHL